MIRRPPRSTLCVDRRQRQMCIRDSLFVVYLRILGVGLIDFISHAYTGCGHAGFRFDVDDAHDAFIGDDFPY